MAEVNPAIRLIILTGGPGAGKTVLSRRLYCHLPKNWRIVPLDNFIGISFRVAAPGDWPDKTVSLGEICLEYWRKEKRYGVLVDGVIQNDEQVRRLCTAFGVGWPSARVRLIQLDRSFETHRKRRASDAEWDPPMGPGQTRDQAFENLEQRVPGRIPGARIIVTDQLTEGEVFECALQQLV